MYRMNKVIFIRLVTYTSISVNETVGLIVREVQGAPYDSVPVQDTRHQHQVIQTRGNEGKLPNKH